MQSPVLALLKVGNRSLKNGLGGMKGRGNNGPRLDQIVHMKFMGVHFDV